MRSAARTANRLAAAVRQRNLRGDAMADIQPGDPVSALDEASLNRSHLRAVLASGMGFFTDAYDLFVIGIASTLITRDWNLSSGQLALHMRRELIGTLEVPDGKKVSTLEWMRTPVTKLSGTGMSDALDRASSVLGLGTGAVEVSGVAPVKLAAYG
jgi:hypothetical protein